MSAANDWAGCKFFRGLTERSAGESSGKSYQREGRIKEDDEVLEPFLHEWYRLMDLNMHLAARRYCMGILKGLYQYDEESGSEFKDWATDIPGETFAYVLDEWKKRNKDDKDKRQMRDFLKNQCHLWYTWAKQDL